MSENTKVPPMLAQMMAIAGTVIPQKPKVVRPTRIKCGSRNKICLKCGHKNKKCTCKKEDAK